MKKLLWIGILFILTSTFAYSQHNHGDLILKNINYFTKIPSPSIYRDRIILNKTNTATFTPTFINSPNYEAEIAFQEAINIWSYILNNPGQEIRVKAEWKNIDSDDDKVVLASSSPQGYYTTDEHPDRYFPVALAEAIENENLNGTNYDIIIEINTNSKIKWYYGLDGNTPADYTDFLSVILHELAHGLGFTASYDYNTSTQVGTTQYNYFDQMIVDSYLATATSLLELPNNSTQLGAELVSNDLYIMGQNTNVVSNGNPKIYSPAIWETGSSISHLDEDTYPAGNNNSLMTPGIGKAESIHSPGEITLSILEDMGWSVADLITISEPNSTSYWAKGYTYQIKWSSNHQLSINIDVYKKNSNGNYDYYEQIVAGYTSNPGENAPYTWTVPSNYPAGEYKIKMLDETFGYGLSETFHITETATDEPKNTVFLFQKYGDDYLGEIQIWSEYSNYWKEKSYSATEELPVNSGFSVRSKPGFVDGTTLKFSHMYQQYTEGIEAIKYINHSDFIVVPNEMELEHYQYIFLHLNEAQNASVLSNCENIDNIGTIYFKDPWLYDETTDPKGTRNRGLSAIWYSGSNFNLSVSSQHQGVFLGQTPDPSNPNKPYYSVKASSPQTIYVQGKNRQFYFQNWEADPVGSADFQYPNNLETPVVFNSDGATVKAVMKGTGLSNNPNTYKANNQRKIAKTSNGNLHRVYESMGYVWYERSTNGGEDWVVMNNGHPISSNEAKLPSIAYSDDMIMIVYQEKYGSGYKIILKNYISGVEISTEDIVVSNWPWDYASNTNPVVAFTYYSISPIFVVWKEENTTDHTNDGLKSWYGNMDSQNHIYMEAMEIEDVLNTDVNSVNPSITVDYNTINKAHLAWQQNGDWAETSIKYIQMEWNDNIEEIVFSNYSEPSNTGSYTTDKYPSIACYEGVPTVAWVSYDEVMYFSRVGIRRRIGSSWATAEYLTDYDYDDEINVSINTLTDDYDGNEYMASYVVEGGSIIYYLPEDGEGDWGSNSYDDYVQVCNGEAAFDDAVISSYNTGTAPYVFHTSSLLGGLSKRKGNPKSSTGRELIVSKGLSKTKIMFESFTVDGEPIEFVDVDDTTAVIGKKESLSLFRTKKFSLNEESEFLFGIRYSTVNKKGKAKGNLDAIKLKVVLLDAKSNELLGVLKEITNKEQDERSRKGLEYRLNPEGIGNREVRVEVAMNPESADDITIAKTSKLERSALNKEEQIEVGLREDLLVKEYGLSQNYPNPFNPTTMIKYQIPKEGMVSLKIYDITGQEVQTLVNRREAKGSYEVSFNASNLSSGVYFYRLQSGEYSKTMKMLLLK